MDDQDWVLDDLPDEILFGFDPGLDVELDPSEFWDLDLLTRDAQDLGLSPTYLGARTYPEVVERERRANHAMLRAIADPGEHQRFEELSREVPSQLLEIIEVDPDTFKSYRQQDNDALLRKLQDGDYVRSGGFGRLEPEPVPAPRGRWERLIRRVHPPTPLHQPTVSEVADVLCKYSDGTLNLANVLTVCAFIVPTLAGTPPGFVLAACVVAARMTLKEFCRLSVS